MGVFGGVVITSLMSTKEIWHPCDSLQTVQPSHFEWDSPSFRQIVPCPTLPLFGTPFVPHLVCETTYPCRSVLFSCLSV